MNRVMRLGVLVFLPLVLSAQTLSAQANPVLIQKSKVENPKQLSSTQADPKIVVDRFYREYVNGKYWRDLKTWVDPATYDQLSRVKMFDVEPFTDAQVNTWSYTIGKPRIKGKQAEVPVRLMVGLRRAEAARNLTIVLRNNSGRWQIRNVIYSPKPLPSGEPNDLLHLWKPSKSALSDSEAIDLIAKLPEVQKMRQAVENYAGEKLKLGISIDELATASNPVTTVGVYEYHSDHRTTLQRFLVNTQTREIRVQDRLTGGSISLAQWRNQKDQ